MLSTVEAERGRVQYHSGKREECFLKVVMRRTSEGLVSLLQGGTEASSAASMGERSNRLKSAALLWSQ